MASRPDDSGVSKPLADLLAFLKDRLKDLFFENPGTPPQDIAFTNLIRLRALFERDDRQVNLRDPKTGKSIHDLVRAVKNDRLSGAVVGLFGEPGTVGANATGEWRTRVDQQETRMLSEAEAGGDLPLAFGGSQPPAGQEPTTDAPVGVAAPQAPTGPTDSTEAAAARGGPADVSTGTPLDLNAPPIVAPVSTGGGASGGAGDPNLPEPGTPRQIPGGGELWNVEGTFYLAYKVPGTNVPLVWQVENPERLQAIYGDEVPPPDRELTTAQFKALSPWRGGLTAELVNTDKEPFQQFMSDLEAAAELRPWLLDETFQAVMGVAFLEGRAPTSDELATTDWWNEHTEDERAWMEATATAGNTEIERRKEDAVRQVRDALSERGMNNAPAAVIEYMASQRLTGRWSQDFLEEQVNKIVDPFAPGELDQGVRAAMAGIGTAADAAAVSRGRDAVRQRVLDIFGNRNIDPSVNLDGSTVDPDERVDRLVEEVLDGTRTLESIRQSVDLIATRTPGGRPGGLDVTREQEDRVRQLLQDWVGPHAAQGYDEAWVAEWAGRLRNDPDAEQDLIEALQGARMANLPNWTNPNLRYADIAPIARGLFSQVWGVSPDETDPLFLDVLNMPDRHEAAKVLRTEGLNQNVGKVIDDAFSALSSTSLGDAVVRSPV
jgi:hypothetical protein